MNTREHLIPLVQLAHPIKLWSWLMMAFIVVTTSCSDDDKPAANSAPACLMLSQITEGTAAPGTPGQYTYRYTTDVEYGDHGYPTSIKETYLYKYSDGTSQNSASDQSLQYDANDFLIRTLWQYTSTDKEGKKSASTSDANYTYQNEQLTKTATTTFDNGQTTEYLMTYEYENRKLVKYYASYNNTTTRYEYNGDKVQKMSITDGSGATTTPFVEYNSKGMLVKSIETYGGSTDENRYQYNAENLQMRRERWIDGKATFAMEFEYDTKEFADKSVRRAKKGHPIVPTLIPSFPNVRNITRSASSTGNAAGDGFVTFENKTEDYQYNAQGFPISSSSRTIATNGTTTLVQTRTFTYRCQ